MRPPEQDAAAGPGSRRAVPGPDGSGPFSAPCSPAELFLGFAGISLQGFGGVLAVSQRVLCERRRWLTHEQYLELLSIGQLLPGPNICNLALIMGDRHFGWRGALAALAGLILPPLGIVLAVAALYSRHAAHPAVAGAVRGMGVVSAGLIVGSSLRLLDALRRNPMGMPACLALGGAAFALVALFHVPLVWVLLGMGLAGSVLAWRRLRGNDTPGGRS
jgi:chromate transporter